MKFLLIFLYIVSTLLASESKIALIIGNGSYKHVSSLKNPLHDALDIAKTLKKIGFEVRLLTDASKNDIDGAVQKFIHKLEEEKGVGLFFYAGHGSQLEGNNYLIPVDANIHAEKELKSKGYNISTMLNSMRKANNSTNIIILDACRDNPFADNFQVATRSLGSKTNVDRALKIKQTSSGLTKLDAPPNTLIAFATAPGRVANDGKDRNSPYTSMLIEAIQMEGITVEQVFKEVRSNVLKATNGKQIPWESSSLVSDFYFVEKKEIPLGW